jgi:hypothetical protein
MFTSVPEGYYQTPMWKAKAYACKLKRGFACAACGRKFKAWESFKLEAHHTDEAYAKVPNETAEDLIPLCGKLSGKPCHKQGRYSAWEIRRDRKANWWLHAIRWACRTSWRAVRRAWRQTR